MMKEKRMVGIPIILFFGGKMGSKFAGIVSAAPAFCEDMREAGAGSHEQLPGALMPGVVDLLGIRSEKGAVV